MPQVHGKRTLKGMSVIVHDMVVAGPILASSRRVARFEASDIAVENLMNEIGDKSLHKLCTCRRDLEEETGEEEEVVKMLVEDD